MSIAAANKYIPQPSDAWPPKSPRGWPVIRLRFRATVNPSRSELNGLPDDTEVSFVPMESVCEYGGLYLDQTKPLAEVATGYTYFRDGDVVVAKITPCFENGKGSIAQGLTGGVGFGTTELHVLRPTRQLDPAFLFYLTISHPFRTIGAAHMYGAGGQKRVPDDFVRDFRHPIPSVYEQRAVAAFLDRETARIDALIEKKRRQIALLHEKRAALISHAVAKGLDPSAPMKDSGIDWLGKIPAHWYIRRFRFDLTSIEQGWSPQCDSSHAELHEWGVLKVGCVNGTEFDESEHKRLPDDLAPRTAYEIKPGDILMSRANTTELLGSAVLVRKIRPRLLLCDKLYRMRIDTRSLDSEFVVYAFSSHATRYQLERDATGASASMKNIGQDTIKALVMPRPPVDEQRVIVQVLNAHCERVHQVVAKVHASIDRLREYRTALISAAVTGKLDVRQEVA